ncbi:MAG: cobalamin-dependent protein [Candidatus Krumholzibacteriia bacterium]
MGLGYLAGSLLAHGYQVEIWDASVESDRENLDEKLSRDPFDVVGLSAPTPLINNAWNDAKIAKKHGAITILGGPHLTLQPHESMEKPQVDLVVRGEAEYTIIEILKALEKQGAMNNEQLSMNSEQLAMNNEPLTIDNSQFTINHSRWAAAPAPARARAGPTRWRPTPTTWAAS